MSYILDALKRSERERRGKGPAQDPLLEGGAPSPAPSRPLWPVLLGLALLANAGVLAGYLLLRGPVSPPPPRAEAPSPPPPVRPAPAAQPSQGAAPAPSREQPSPPPSEAPPEPAPAAASPDPPRPPEPTAAEPARQQAAAQSAPATAEASPRAAPASASAPWEALPYLEELPVEFRSSVPEVTVDVHVFTDDPARRFVLLDLRRFREGDELPSGLRLLHITPDGVAVAWQGRRFRLGTR